MNDGFELLDPDSARMYLDGFPSNTRRKGKAYYHQERVLRLAAETPGIKYSATVQGTHPYEVVLLYDPTEGWSGECTCPMEFDCKHVVAAMQALLAQHSETVVRNLSAGIPSRRLAAVPPSKPRSGSASLDVRVTAALGRELDPDEKRFIKKVQQVFMRSRQSRMITTWDFGEMGLPISTNTWGPVQIWPSVPTDEHRFWLYVAHAVRENGEEIPTFMEGITDLREIQEELNQWRREENIRSWKFSLSQPQPTPPGSVAFRGEYDLRLMISPDEARLQWKRPGKEAFEYAKPGPFRQLTQDYMAGRMAIPPEGELIWNVFYQRMYQRGELALRYLDSEARATLGRLIRTRLLTDRIVNQQGQPLQRVTAPLRWTMAPAESEKEDYRIYLAQADGSAAPPILCNLPGNPPLYLALDAVYEGPPPQDHLLKTTAENLIPAPAIESREGLTFLVGLGLETPPRLRDRIRTLPLEVAIHCSVRPIYPGSTTEDCSLKVVASAADGHEEIWNGQTWVVSKVKESRAKVKDSALTIYDRSLLQDVPQLLAPLNPKRLYFDDLGARITRKFPEEFADWLKTLPPYIKVQLAGELASFANASVAGRVKLDVTEAEIDWFDLRVVLDVSDTTLTQQELKVLLDAKGKFVRLKGKGWRRMQFDLSPEEDERLARLGISPRELTSEPQRLHALQLADEAAKKFLPAEQAEQIRVRASEIKARVAPPLPEGISAELRPYQLEGFHFLAYLSTNRFGGVLADDMGLGKTLQALVWLTWLREQEKNTTPVPPAAKGAPASAANGSGGEMRPTLIVCPKSVTDNWRAEAERFVKGLRIKAWSAGELSGLVERVNEADVHVINYSQLRILGETLVPIRWLCVVLDEGQYIKNPSSQTAQIARALHAQHRLVLSGTPIENRLMDLWSLMAFAMPGMLGSRNQFGKLYDNKSDPFARRRLASRVRPFLLRRTKTQVAKDLPDRIEEDLFCEMEGEQKTLYRAELKRAQQILLAIKTQKQLAKERFHFLTSLLRLRQVCCHPALVKGDSKAASAKLEALLEQLEPLIEEGNKVLVFSQFVELLALVEPALRERNWKTFKLTGSTEDRGALVRDFQTTEGAAVFLISLKAGGFGLNLTAASYVVLFDPWWNPAVENQAIDRTHRIGQVNKVIAYRLLIKDSIEEKIRALQKQKSALAQDVLGEERFAQSLTLEDLQFLFAD